MRMNTISSIAAMAGLLLLASPGLAQVSDSGTRIAQRTDPDSNVRLEMNRDNYRLKKAGEGNTPRLFAGPGISQGNDVFDCTGKYLGSDPDPTVRVRMLSANAGDACK
jgi:hypothetical protein